MNEDDERWMEAVKLVTDWAAHNGLIAGFETDGSLEPEFHAGFINVTADPRIDSHGVRMARPTVAQLVRRYMVRPDGTRLQGFPATVEVRLVRHGRQCTVLAVTPEELQRFGLEARHLDRID